MSRIRSSAFCFLCAVIACGTAQAAPRIVSRLTVTNPAPSFKDYFGMSIASVGSDKFIVGMPQDPTASENWGAAYLMSTNGTALLAITNPAPEAYDRFGAAVAGLGSDKLVVGADMDNAGATDSGSAYLFSTNGTLLATITNPVPQVSGWFGAAIAAVDSHRFVVGAQQANSGTNSAGSVYLYNDSGVLQRAIPNPAPSVDDRFGYSLGTASGGRILVGTPYDDVNGVTNAGSAYVYDLDGNLLLTITNPTPAADDLFGWSVAGIGPDRIAVGAIWDDTGTSNGGCVYLYDLGGALLVTITNPAQAAYDYFGNAVAEIGDRRLLVGAESGGYQNTGSAWIFDMNGQRLATLTNTTFAWDESFGHALCGIGSNLFAVTTPFFESGGSGAYHKYGTVYLYSFEDERSFFVNDTNLTGDAWCTAVGSDANPGTNASSPKASIQALLSAYDLEPRDTIYVDTGLYPLTSTNIAIGSSDSGSDDGLVKILGSPQGVSLSAATTITNVIDFNSASNVLVSGLLITGGQDGVRFMNASKCVLDHVTVRNTIWDGIYMYGATGNRLESFEVSGCARYGVNLHIGCSNNVLSHGIVWSNSQMGVRVAADSFVPTSYSNLVDHCTLAYNAVAQLYVADHAGACLSNSVIVADGVSNSGVFVADTYTGGPGAYRGDYNDLYAVNGADITKEYVWDRSPPPTTIGYTNLINWQIQYGVDLHSFSADPLFVSRAGDFHLRSFVASGTWVTAAAGWTNFPGEYSPCIDAGDPSAPFASEPQFAGGAADLGAYGNTAEASKSRVSKFYVNDASMSGDVWCTAAGSDANAGDSPSSPKATVNAVLDAFDLGPGDTVYVDTGFYEMTTGIVVDAADAGSESGFVTFQGSPAGAVLSYTNWPQMNFLVNSAQYVRISGLSFTGSCWHAVHIRNSPRCVLDGIRVRNARSIGVYIEDSASNEVVGVDIGRCGYNGLDARRCPSLTIRESRAWSNEWDGLYIYASANVTVRSCVLAHNGILAHDTAWSMTNSILFDGDVVSIGNCVYQGDYNDFYAPNGYHGTLPGTSGNDRHSLMHDPSFADSTNGDFHLRSVTGRRLENGTWAADSVHSACIDAAAPWLACSNEPAPNGARANIGCDANSAEASKSRTNAWVLATSFNNGGRLSGTTEVFWVYGNLSDTNRVRIECSLDDGATWQSLASNVSIQGSFVWDTTLTAVSTPVARWRVAVQGNAGLSDATDRPFELRNGSMNFYVNDLSLVGDVWCTAAGNDTNSGGSPGAPKASVSAVMDTYDLEPGDTVHIDTGYYLLTTNITVDYEDEGSQASGPVTFKGSPNGVTLDRGVKTSGTFCFGNVYARWLRVEDLLLTNGEDGLVVQGEGCVFSNIAVRNAGRYGVYVRTYTQKFYGLDVRECQDGLNATHGEGVDYENCVFAWNFGDGAHLQYFSEGYVAHSRMKNCTIAYNGYKQIDLTGYYRLDLRDSVVVASGANNACIFKFYQRWIGAHGSQWGSAGLYVGDYNLLFAENGATIGGNSDEGYTNHAYSTLADWRAFSGQDSNSVSAEPKFVDGGDFHLRSSAASGTYVIALGGWTNFAGENSPAIDAGCPTNACAGEPQWDGGIVNAGAYGNTPFASRSADSDGDWLSDSIEVFRNFTNPGDADSDHDGMGDRFEVLAGTCATNGSSVFASECAMPAGAMGSQVVVSWPSAPDRTYSLQRGTSLRAAFTNFATGVVATPPMNSVTVTVSGVEREMFRVGLEQ